MKVIRIQYDYTNCETPSITPPLTLKYWRCGGSLRSDCLAPLLIKDTKGHCYSVAWRYSSAETVAELRYSLIVLCSPRHIANVLLAVVFVN